MNLKYRFIQKTAVLGMAIAMIAGSASAAASPIAKEQWVQEHAHEITSLTSDNYSDLAFLKPLLQDKKVVSLGENFHRVAEYSAIKTRMIKFLHEELGYDVIAFESGMGDAAVAYEQGANLTPAQMMELSIFPIWHSQRTLGLYEYIQEQSKTDHPLILAGYDMQFTTGYLTQFISDWISGLDPARGKQFYAFEMQGITDLYTVLNKYGIDSDNNPEFKAAIHQVKDAYAPQYEELVQWVSEHKQELVKSFPDNPKLADMMIRVLKDRSKFIEMAAYDTRESYEFRDRAMADNLEWLMDVMYPGKKFILWAHNDHLAKSTSTILNPPIGEINGNSGLWQSSFKSMGEMMHEKLQDDMYVIGLYMNEGQASEISTGQTFDISPMPRGSLEYTLMKSGYRNTYIDLSEAKDAAGAAAWLSRPVFAAEDGMVDEVIHPMSMNFIPTEQYDGILLIDKVKAPTTTYKGGFKDQMQQQK